MKSLLLSVIAIVFLTIFSFAQNTPTYVPTNGLVGWWPFNGNANDESGNGNNGTVNGATLTTDRFGNTNTSYYFNGANSNFIEIPSSASLNSTNSNFSWSFWIKFSSISNDGWNSNPGVISKTQNGTTCNGATLIEGGGRLAAQNLMNCGTNLINNGVGTNQITADNIWHHVVMTLRNGDSTKTYIDGVFQQSNIVDITYSIYSNTPIRIGRPTDPYWKSFTGIIDDIAIYNRALTQEEITQLYTACSTPFTSEFSIAACEQYQLPWGDSTVTTTGDYLHTYQSVDGCDSNVTAHVTINHAVAGASFNASGISTYTLPWGEEVTSSGYYTHLYQNEYGCDSLVTAYVVINTPPNSENTNVGINVENPQRSLHVKDVLRLEPRSTPPTNPTKGDMYFDDTINKLRVYNGTRWDNL